MNLKGYCNFDESERLHTRLWTQLNSEAFYRPLGPLVTFEKGTLVASVSVVPEFCYYVLEGRVVSLEYTPSSEERYYNFNEAGSLLLEACVLMEKAPPVSFVALTTVRAVRISREVLLKQLRENPDFALDVVQGLSYKFVSAMDQVREVRQFTIFWKVCNLLLTFCERYGVDQGGKTLIKEKISQQLLANLLGVNRITMVRTIKALREYGLLELSDGFYCVPDQEKMRSFMETVGRP